MNQPAIRRHVLAPHVGPAPGTFVDAWWNRHPVATRWLTPSPQTPEAWRTVTSNAVSRPLPAALADQLSERQRAMDTGPIAIRNARRLAEPRTRVVVTGQQPSPYGGALLVLHKAATAVSLAKHLASVQPDLVFVPCFWLADDDHDVDEAASVTVRNTHGQSQRVRIPFPRDRRSLRHQPFTADLAGTVHENVHQLLPATVRSHDVLTALAPRSDEPYAAWVGRCLATYMGDSGLVVLEPELLEPEIATHYSWLRESSPVITNAIRDAGNVFDQAGLPQPLSPSQATMPFFIRDVERGPRVRPPSEDALPTAQAVGREPWRLSVDVVSRVLMQNKTLPVVAHVVGPTEMAYVAQIAAAAEATNQTQPLVWPRIHASWMDAKTNARMEQSNLSWDSLFHPPTPRAETAPGYQASARLAKDGEPKDNGEAASRLASQLATHLDEYWHRFLLEVDQALNASQHAKPRSLWQTQRDVLHKRWLRIRKMLERAAQQSEQSGARTRTRVMEVLRPRGRPQERVVCPLSLAARHGLEVIEAGLQALDPLERNHQVLGFD